jgi:hypothetical protein
MKTNNRFIPVVLICMAFITGCTKEEASCDTSLVPQITANTTVTAGGTLNLSVSGIENVKLYNWYGPNNFSSHEQNPSITNVSGVHAGRYTVDVITADGCIYSAVSEPVTVGGAQTPCNVTNNTASLDGAGSINFSFVTGAPSGGSYFITANGSGGDMEFEFAGTGKPVNGIYDIQSLSGTWGAGKVRVRITASSSLWYPGSGSVYVTVANNKVTASFCNVQFTSQTFGFKANGSAKVTER